jgi:hypothetical protein
MDSLASSGNTHTMVAEQSSNNALDLRLEGRLYPTGDKRGGAFQPLGWP